MTGAEAFRRLHQDGLLILANAWDAGSARLIESLGAPAIATTSAGVAWAHGYADGDLLPVPLLLATVHDIARVNRVPLTVDCEGGYSSDPAAVGETIAAVVEAGGVGINLEDGSGPPDLLCAKIEHIKRAVARRGADVFVNARTDVYLRSLAPAGARRETLARRALPIPARGRPVRGGRGGSRRDPCDHVGRGAAGERARPHGPAARGRAGFARRAAVERGLRHRGGVVRPHPRPGRRVPEGRRCRAAR
jgi:hypothetical protein